jgi:hypothetical protein
MDLVELGAKSIDLVDLEFLELGCLAEKNGVELFLWIWSCVELSQTRPKQLNFHDCVFSERLLTLTICKLIGQCMNHAFQQTKPTHPLKFLPREILVTSEASH